jgi:hypothetical protein
MCSVLLWPAAISALLQPSLVVPELPSFCDHSLNLLHCRHSPQLPEASPELQASLKFSQLLQKHSLPKKLAAQKLQEPRRIAACVQ